MAYELECGGPAPTPLVLAGAGGSGLPFFVAGTDPAIGGTVDQIVDMTTEADDFTPSALMSGGTFIICIETDAPIKVKLFDGSDFTITQAQATAYLGTWYPALLTLVYKAGTTGTFSVGR